jgi:hypothetical protein
MNFKFPVGSEIILPVLKLMGQETTNQTWVSEFILLGLSSD